MLMYLWFFVITRAPLKAHMITKLNVGVLQYVARYEENVTPGMIASVPSQGNEQMAASILQVFPSLPPSQV